jgi:hypothetical protein
MKKFIFIAIAMIAFTITSFAQDREVSKSLGNGISYYKYTGVAADTLTSNQDTIDLTFSVALNGNISRIAVKTRFDLRAGADTTVSIGVYGKDFTDDGLNTVVAPVVTSAIAANNTVVITESAKTSTIASYTSTTAAFKILSDTTGLLNYPQDTLNVPIITLTNAAQTVTDNNLTWRKYTIRYIIKGDDSVGTGIKLDEVEIKLWQ